jgi:hypothetical protein
LFPNSNKSFKYYTEQVKKYLKNKYVETDPSKERIFLNVYLLQM